MTIVDNTQEQSNNIKELQNTLRARGYEDFEISKAIRAISSKFQLKTNEGKAALQEEAEDIQALIKASLVWLSNESN